MTELIVALRNLANAPKNGKFIDEECGGESDSLFKISLNFFGAPGFSMVCETHGYKYRQRQFSAAKERRGQHTYRTRDTLVEDVKLYVAKW
jgi:hypothetical protein